MTELERLMQYAPSEEDKREIYGRLAGRTTFLQSQIHKMESEMEGADVLQTYNNGGNQTGKRVNPLMRLYLACTKEYRSCLRDLAALSKDPDEELDEFDRFM